LLNWARVELEIGVKDDITSRPYQIVEELNKVFEVKLDEKQLKIINNVPEETSLTIHPDLLRIVLRNLLSNAIKYSHKQSFIDIGYDVSQQKITIKDSGLGMDKAELKSLFSQPVFSQIGTEHETGFGIGLYITAELLRKIGWSIEVQSEKGKGTTFFVCSTK